MAEAQLKLVARRVCITVHPERIRSPAKRTKSKTDRYQSSP